SAPASAAAVTASASAVPRAGTRAPRCSDIIRARASRSTRDKSDTSSVKSTRPHLPSLFLWKIGEFRAGASAAAGAPRNAQPGRISTPLPVVSIYHAAAKAPLRFMHLPQLIRCRREEQRHFGLGVGHESSRRRYRGLLVFRKNDG